MNRGQTVTVVITLLVLAITIVLSLLQNTIINALRPAQAWLLAYVFQSAGSFTCSELRCTSLHRTPGAWLIPIAIMIVLSFPPVSLIIFITPFASLSSVSAFWTRTSSHVLRYCLGLVHRLPHCRSGHRTWGAMHLLVRSISTVTYAFNMS